MNSFSVWPHLQKIQLPIYEQACMCLVFAYEYKFEFEKDSNIAKNKQQSMHSTVRRTHVTS